MRKNIKELFSKKSDISSIIYITIFLAISGVIIFFIVHLNIKLFTELEYALNDTEYNESEAYDRTTEFKEKNESRLWDYAFLGIFMGSLMAIGLSAYSVRISPIFYWVYGILSMVVLVLGTMLSNIWQEMVSDPEFTTTLVHFPITNSILGTYYPMVVTAVIILAMVVLFGKPPGQEAGYY